MPAPTTAAKHLTVREMDLTDKTVRKEHPPYPSLPVLHLVCILLGILAHPLLLLFAIEIAMVP